MFNYHRLGSFATSSVMPGCKFRDQNFEKVIFYLIQHFRLKEICFTSSTWEKDPSSNTIDRVPLSELDFPAVTICPDWSSDSFAIQTVYNMYGNF